MDVNRSLPTRKLPSPKPNSSFSSFKYNENPMLNGNGIINNQQISQISTTFIPCQTTLNLHPIGKPMPNRRGRKPLTTMPTGKKHKQNLTNQRAFRQRKAYYIRTLEIRASKLEIDYAQALTEIKTLKDKIRMLEKKLISSRSRNEAIKNSNDRDPNTHFGEIVDPTTIYIYDENKDGSCDVTLNDPIPKDSELFCETPGWIASTSAATTPLYPTLNPRDNETPFPSSQDSESQWIQPYFAPASTTITTTAGSAYTSHHPLNLRWILSDSSNEE